MIIKKYETIFIYGILLDLITTTYGLSIGLVEGNPLNIYNVFILNFIVIGMFFAIQDKIRFMFYFKKYRNKIKYSYLIFGLFRFGCGLLNLILIWLIL